MLVAVVKCKVRIENLNCVCSCLEQLSDPVQQLLCRLYICVGVLVNYKADRTLALNHVCDQNLGS